MEHEYHSFVFLYKIKKVSLFLFLFLLDEEFVSAEIEETKPYQIFVEDNSGKLGKNFSDIFNN
ncbi:hypothetical protein KJ644_04045 [Candidatus Dependentiae bacterium]|nr:hypothetical protein [Candidatus Dependentiae bacterium]MBU4387617.1 hypothetical protein [Candidatus Dependentiae bacterium]MCG2756470.1 hypothetical protein [Candidatus Dependentiae bacterium]